MKQQRSHFSRKSHDTTHNVLSFRHASPDTPALAQDSLVRIIIANAGPDTVTYKAQTDGLGSSLSGSVFEGESVILPLVKSANQSWDQLKTQLFFERESCSCQMLVSYNINQNLDGSFAFTEPDITTDGRCSALSNSYSTYLEVKVIVSTCD